MKRITVVACTFMLSGYAMANVIDDAWNEIKDPGIVDTIEHDISDPIGDFINGSPDDEELHYLMVEDLIKLYEANIEKLESVIDDRKEIERQISSVKSSTMNFEQESELINDDIKKLRKKIEELKQAIQSANTYELNLLLTEITKTNTSVTDKHTKVLMNTFQAIRSEYIVRKNLDVLNKEVGSLDRFVEIANFLDQLLNQTISEIETTGSTYNDWYIQFNQWYEDMVAQASSIDDDQSYKKFIASINGEIQIEPDLSIFQEKQKQLDSEVKRLRFLENELTGFADNHFGISRQDLFDKESLESYFVAKQAFHEQLFGAISYLRGINEIFEKRESGRRSNVARTKKYLVGLANSYLHAANASNASEVIEASISGLRDSALYNSIITKINTDINHINKLQSSFVAFRTARMKSLALLGYIDRHLESLDTQSISESMRGQIEAELLDFKAIVNQEYNQSRASLSREDYYSTKRNRYFEVVTTRYKDRVSASCLSMSHAALSISQNTLDHEEMYVELRGECL